jgi:hypothetical protein
MFDYMLLRVLEKIRAFCEFPPFLFRNQLIYPYKSGRYKTYHYNPETIDLLMMPYFSPRFLFAIPSGTGGTS